ncbi:amidase [Algoriphagus jejuensis]
MNRYAIWVTALLLCACVSTKKKGGITRQEVKTAQRLIGLEFERPAIDTMRSYLERNRSGYLKMREFELPNETAPALYFDPFPVDFTFSAESPVQSWAIPDNVALPSDPESIAFLPILDLASLIKHRKISAIQLTELYLDRIRAHDSKLMSFITVTEDLALAQAKKADQEIASGHYRGPLHGIPYGVKDLASVPGYPTTWGAAPYQDQVIDETASVVKKLEEAGAVLLGKLVSGSLARGDVWFGGKTKNPWDLSQGATGSSAGSGSATSAGLVAFAIGTETLGSIISPSHRCGVTGLRPTFGTVSRHGFMTLSWSMDKVGPIGRSAVDCAVVYDYIRGKDGLDKTVKPSGFDYSSKIGIEGLKIGYFQKLFEPDSGNVSPDLTKTIEEFKQMGIELHPLELPKEFPFSVFDIILRAEAGAFFDELVRSGGVDEMVEQHGGSRANSLRQARFIPAVEYLQANRHRAELIEQFTAMIQEYDVILSPTSGFNQSLITNLTGHPALSLPTGFDEKNRPTGITLLANYFDEAKLLQVAEAFQQAYSYHGLVPTGVKAGPTTEDRRVMEAVENDGLN